MSELRIVITAYALLAAMILAGVIGLRRRLGAVLLSLLSIVWLTLDRAFEGPLLIELTPSHGIVLADLVGITGIGVALGMLLFSRR